MRLLIAGVPRAGKTTLAVQYSCARAVRLRSSDDLIGSLAWSAVSEECSRWFNEPGPWVAEGVALVRSLRKWLASHATGRPCDEILWLGTPRVPLTSGQAAMAKACETVWNEVRPELERRGVVVRFG
jgi:adenylate kinase family enzyme